MAAAVTLLVSLLITLILIPNSKAAPSYRYSICPNTTLFNPNSEYQTNLQTVFDSLSTNSTDASGFSTASSSDSSNGEAVYGLFLCRGDIDSNTCRDCVTKAVSDLQQKYCPGVKVAYIWYDECMVRYSNQSFFGQMQQSPFVRFWNTQNMTGNLTHFTEMVGEIMSNVSAQAVSDSGLGGKKYFATDSKAYDYLQTVYGLGQCTPDLSVGDCAQCLADAIARLPVSHGGRTLFPSCNVRYESYPFYFLSSTPPPSPAPPLPINTTATTTSVTGPPHHGKKQLSAGVIIVIVAPIVIIIVVLAAFLIKRKAKKYDAETVETGEDFSGYESLNYDLGTLRSATDNFSEEKKLGEGGFGCVYKGTLPNGYEIAVKKLSMNSGQGVQEFKNEASLVAKLQHRNLVRLMGFCLDGVEKLLVYEYVPNKSLDVFLFDQEKRRQLSWERRYKIISGIARGMLYLHQDSQLRIIHRDLKASNVLLDADMNPKISDFGMARIFGLDQTQANTERVVGTYGYMSPEYAMHGMFSVKSDVYSFGILILEIVSGKRNSTFEEAPYVDLLNDAWMKWRDGVPLEFVDPTIWDSCSMHEVMRCLHLGLLCAQEAIDMRPTMGRIVLTLDSYSVTLPVPQQPDLVMKNRVQSNFIEANSSDQSSTKSMPWSVNEITMSEVDVR